MCHRSHGSLFWIAVQLLQFISGQDYIQDLGGDDWKATGVSALPGMNRFQQVKGTVPGCIHTDWYDHIGHRKENDPFYRFNDGLWKDIADMNWVYEKTFIADQRLGEYKEQWLVCEGLDTIANISLNTKLLGTSKNMFVRHFFNVTGVMQDGFNLMQVSFESATRYANRSSDALKYSIPPECPPDVQHGYCHVNLIRKQQSSFSWDWGPGFASQGIWKPIYMIGVNEAVLTDVSLSYDWGSEALGVDVRYLLTGSVLPKWGSIQIFIDELSIHNRSHVISVNGTNPTASVIEKIPAENLELWWPNGQGEQKLYNITVHFQVDGSHERSFRTLWFGFRKVELVQTRIDSSKGLSFYFKINGRSVFAKGSNWIPGDAFPSRVTKSNYTNLLQSAKDANMNMLRVWGGGVYERDEFYELADSMGIMIWQDFMFACALYPSDPSFLESVTQEIKEAMWRLKSHPSIVLWAGNNENEAALATNWYNTSDNFERYKKDYVALYIDTIGKTAKQLDSTRPYLSSSPTNGAETQSEGWVAKNPYDAHYGDVHYYNYDADCLDWTKYPKTRFASEYGYQSFSSVQTMSAVSLSTDLIWNSSFLIYRNHHSDGDEQIMKQIIKHFNITSADSKEEWFSNIMQGLCYKGETEFYRRSRSEIVDGEGHTMGALYWQLNDVWQTTSWSSIEYGGSWKALHYFAKNFFANVTLSVIQDGTFMSVYSLSDVNQAINVTLVIEARLWGNFKPLHSWKTAVKIDAQSSKLLRKENINNLLQYAGCKGKEFCYTEIYLEELPDVAPTYFYPASFKNIVGMKKPIIQVQSVVAVQPNSSEIAAQQYLISLTSSAPAFFVMLEVIGVKGRFSDNAFHMRERKVLEFHAWESTSVDAVKSSLRIKSLADTSLGDDVITADENVLVSEEVLSDRIPVGVWLDDVQAQLAFGVCGILFLLFFAVLLVCVVMRFSNPHLKKRHSLLPESTPQKPTAVVSRHPEEVFDHTGSCGAFLLHLQDPSKIEDEGVQVMFYVR